MQESLKDGSAIGDAKKRSDYEKIFNDVIENVFKRGEKRRRDEAAAGEVVDRDWGGDMISGAAFAAAGACGGGGGGFPSGAAGSARGSRAGGAGGEHGL